MAKASLLDEAVSYDVAKILGDELRKKGNYEEAKGFFLVVLEGRRTVLGDEHKGTLTSLDNMKVIPDLMRDYKGELDCYQHALMVQEKVLGKTHPDTLRTIMNMAIVYEYGLKDFPKAEEMYRRTLDRYEKSPGKEHEKTKM